MALTLGIVQVCSGPRAKGAAARKLGSHSLVELVVRRVTDCQRLDQVLVVADEGLDHSRLAELVPPDVPIHSSSRPDMLGRFASAVAITHASAVVRVCADNPFVEPMFIDRLVSTADAHPECDYISYCSADGRPTILSALGVFAEWCRAGALLQADREASAPADREQVTRYLYSHPEKFQLRFIPVPPELDRDDMRLTVDSEEDWEHAQTIYDALGFEGLDWQRIAGLLRRQPALRQRMAVLNRKHAQA
ncbi:MAG: NTP transferase domain-containing protein [Pirellulales bacterium]